MPLKGKAKRDYQREYMREKRVKLKLKDMMLDPSTKMPVRPNKPKPILDVISPSVKREGYGKASSTVTPELDADGNPIPDVT